MVEIINFLSNEIVSLVLLGYVAVLWIALAFWASIDIFARSENWFVRFGAIILVAGGFIFGFALYLIIRPTHTSEESKMREFEEKLLENQSRSFLCPKCAEVVRDDFLFCTNCSHQVKKTCPSCTRPIEIVWQACPFCGTSVVPVLLPVSVKELGSGKENTGRFSGLFRLFKKSAIVGEVKRGRGRPRKYPPEIKVNKRPVGRPRKYKTDETIIKRGRGRPPKTTFPSA